MHYIIYKITNKLNNKIYIGKHICKSIYDCYMGSSIHLLNDIKKYGKENFHKDILFECQNEKELNEKELQIVNRDFVQRSDTYNRQIGGIGGNKIDFTKHPEIIEANKKNSNIFWDSIKNDDEKHKRHNLTMKLAAQSIKTREDYDDIKKQIQKTRSEFYKTHDGSFKGKRHSAETKKQMSISAKKFHALNGPAWDFNHHWYYDPYSKVNKLLKEEDYEREYKKLGWKKGRWIFK